MSRKISIIMFLASILFIFFFVTCSRRPTLSDIMQINDDQVIAAKRFAVVRPSILRLKSSPKNISDGIGTLYKNDIVEVLIMSNQTSDWCKTISNGNEGWILIDKLILFRSIEEANRYLLNPKILTDIE